MDSGGNIDVCAIYSPWYEQGKGNSNGAPARRQVLHAFFPKNILLQGMPVS
jgi:hypothetical protein